MATRRKKAASTRKPDALRLLRSDHEEVSALFRKYEKGTRLGAEEKRALAERICDALTIHAKIEEEIFYPACDEAVQKAEDLLAEARVEHQTLKDLIAKIEAQQPGTCEFDAEVKVLGEYVKHHVKEEQGELFPKVRKSDLDLESLGSELAERKSSLQQPARGSLAGTDIDRRIE
ncbi:MAG TPA: hemerythrin domain-containing protein [Candidatus Acidoferrum sp.]|nr:hemerythrin domain-containing protein [Candidatus Acidoferrum sp.]